MLVRAGRHILNLDHMVRAEEGVPAAGSIRIHVLRGAVIELDGDDAQELRLALLAACPPMVRRISQGVVVEPGP